MRQLLIRIPHDLHARLTVKAKRDGVSVNALANAALQAAAPPAGGGDDVDSRRHGLREKARELGILVESPTIPVTTDRFEAALRETEEAGPVTDELWAEGR